MRCYSVACGTLNHDAITNVIGTHEHAGDFKSVVSIT